ncbi:DUF975 family protein [Candidatus Falkowbacteria bacterium]|nr:DUF975 family protein [Candidatus Falkowbacteria bacterium]
MQKTEEFNIKKALTTGWNLMVERFFVFFLALFIIAAFASSSDYLLRFFKDAEVFNLLLRVIFYAVSVLLTLGFIKINLLVINKKKPHINELFSCYDRILQQIIADVISLVIILIGFVFLIIPGIYLAVRLQFTSFFIVDKNMKAIDALKASFKITKGRALRLFFFDLLLGLINVLGFFTFAVGLFFSIPTTSAAMTLVYRELSTKK